MLEQYIRPQYQYYFVDHVIEKIQHRIKPIQVTLLSGIFGIMVPVALYYQQRGLAIILLLISGYLDTVDGSIARNRNLISDQGSLLDIFTDRVVESAVIIGLFLYAPYERSFLCLFMLCSVMLCVTSFLTVGIFTENKSHKSFHYSPGLIERPEAFIFFILMMIFTDYFTMLSILFILLVLCTTFIRIYEFLRA